MRSARTAPRSSAGRTTATLELLDAVIAEVAGQDPERALLLEALYVAAAMLVAGDVHHAAAHIERVGEELAQASPAMLERARALTDLGAAQRRANRRADAHEPLREGLDLAQRCGAAVVVERARSELLATVARPGARLSGRRRRRRPVSYAVSMAREQRPGDVSDKAVIELGPIAARLREQIALDEDDWQLVLRALTRALMAGVRIGGAEVAAQAIESGMPVTLDMRVQTAERDDE